MPTRPAEDRIYCLEIPATLHDAVILQELLGTLDVPTECWQDAGHDTAFVRLYCLDESERDDLLATIRARRSAWEELLNDTEIRPQLRTVMKEDWAESWKLHFRPQRVSRRIVVKPSWEQWDAAPDDVVLEIDPGMSFGTGQHGTTKACLEFLDDLRDELGAVSCLDLGCGSGILALAARKLGYDPVTAVDIDPDAVRIARENLERAGVTDIALVCVDLAAYEPEAPARVVLANILAPVLEAHADRIVTCLDCQNESRLILSGILTTQYDDVRCCFEARNLREVRTRTIDEWTSGCFAPA